MPESAEKKRLRQKVKYDLKKENPDWDAEQIKNAASEKLKQLLEQDRKGTVKGQKGQKKENKGTETDKETQITTKKTAGTVKGQKGTEKPLKLSTKLFVKLVYNKKYSFYSVYFSYDGGLHYDYKGRTKKNQGFEVEGIVIVGSWIEGSGKNGEDNNSNTGKQE